MSDEPRHSKTRLAVACATVCVLGVFALAAPAAGQQGQRRSADRAIAAARAGGVIVACRHAITDSFSEREPIDYSDPESQRRLSDEGEDQARAIGEAMRRLGIDITEAVASPMDRARRTADLMTGLSSVVDPIWHTNDDDYDGPNRDRRRAALAQPVPGGVRLISSHITTMRSVLEQAKGDFAEGDCVVVRPGGEGGRTQAGYLEIGAVPWRSWIEAAEREGVGLR